MKYLLFFFLVIGSVNVVLSQDSPFVVDKVLPVYINMTETDWHKLTANPLENEWFSANLTYNGIQLNNVGVRTKGASSLRYAASQDSDRYSFKVRTDKYVSHQKLLGVTKLNFNNGFKDPSFMRETLGYELFRQFAGDKAGRTSYADLHVAGQLHGLYTIVEQVDEDFLEDRFFNPDGDLYKSTGTKGGNLKWEGDSFDDYPTIDLKTNEKTSNGQAFVDFVNLVNTANSTAAFEKGMMVEEVLANIAVDVVLANLDSMIGNGNNAYYYDNQGRAVAIPWDLNECFGVFKCGGGSTINTNINTPQCGPVNDFPLVSRFIPMFREQYHDLIKHILATSFNQDFMTVRISHLTNLLQPYVFADNSKFYSNQQFLCAVDTDVSQPLCRDSLLEFVLARSESILNQL